MFVCVCIYKCKCMYIYVYVCVCVCVCVCVWVCTHIHTHTHITEYLKLFVCNITFKTLPEIINKCKELKTEKCIIHSALN